MLQGNNYVEKPANLDFPKSNGLVRYESAVTNTAMPCPETGAEPEEIQNSRGEGIQSLSAKFPVGR